jgi:hypothetical protein
VAAKPVDGDSSALLKLANHASKLLREFTDLEPGQRYRMAELLAELEHVIAEFRRLRPPPDLPQRASATNGADVLDLRTRNQRAPRIIRDAWSELPC